MRAWFDHTARADHHHTLLLLLLHKKKIKKKTKKPPPQKKKEKFTITTLGSDEDRRCSCGVEIGLDRRGG